MNNFRKYIPMAVALVIFLIITAIYFKPFVIDGKQIRQGDIQHHKGMAKEIVDFREKNKREPLWTNGMFGGMPAYQISVLYPSNFLDNVQRAFPVLTRIPFPITAVLLCMIGFYFLLVTLKVNPWVSIAGAIAFGMSSYLMTIIPAGHNSKIYAIAYMAPVVMGVLMTFRGRLWLGAALTCISLALEINANHLQITYYLMILLVFLGIGEVIRLVKEKQTKYLAKAVGLLALVVVLAILPNVGNLMLTSEYSKYTTRGPSELTIDNTEQTKTEGLPIEYATQWSYSKSETMTLLIPDFMGGASEPIGSYDKGALKKVDDRWKDSIAQQGSYFGDVIFTSGPYYVGAIICFLFVLGLFIVKDNIKWWLLGATVLTIMLAWGRHFLGLTEFFFAYVPGYDKFRAVSMILVVVDLTMPLLAMLAIREIMMNAAIIKQKINQFYIALAITGGLAMLVWMMPGAFVTTVNDSTQDRIQQGLTQQGGTQNDVDEYIANLEIARESVVRSDAGRSFLFILLAAGLLYFYIRKPFHVGFLAAGLGLLVLIDMWDVGDRYMNKDSYSKSTKVEVPYRMSAADEMILQDKDPGYRVLNLAVDAWQDASTSYFHKSIGGYHGAKLKRTQELYEQVMSKQIDALQAGLRIGLSGGPGGDSIVDATLAQQSTLNMLNAKYIIYNPEGGVIVNKTACGDAWFVQRVKIVPNADSEIVAVKTIDPSMTAVVDDDFQAQLTGVSVKYDSTATIKVVSYTSDKIVYESNAKSDQVAIFPEIYYPKGWNATIDGKPSEHFRANYVLRGIKVPAGKHTIQFEFHPDSYYNGQKVAMFGSVMVFLFLGAGIYMDWRTKQKESKAA
ncbi:MAG TPA: YfhO family protein [Bacteroidia bacterium]|nr:YfhO family protein [Bacteroidia bacterium]